MVDYLSLSDELMNESDRVHRLLKQTRDQIREENARENKDQDLIQDLHLDVARHYGVLEGLNIAGSIAYREAIKSGRVEPVEPGE